MKEAVGEANLTSIAIILIGIVVTVANPIINRMALNSAYRSCCSESGGVWDGGRCLNYGSSSVSDEYKACWTDAGLPNPGRSDRKDG